ncbi:hypothetical protein D3C83_262730 [compost metagenome]
MKTGSTSLSASSCSASGSTIGPIKPPRELKTAVGIGAIELSIGSGSTIDHVMGMNPILFSFFLSK